jgi:hypothetical protein
MYLAKFHFECSVNQNVIYVRLLISGVKVFDGRTDKWTIVMRQQQNKYASVYLSIFVSFCYQIKAGSLPKISARQEKQPYDHPPQLGVAKSEWIHTSTSPIRLHVMVFI